MKGRCVECGVAWRSSAICRQCLEQMERERQSTNMFPWPVAMRGPYILALVGVADKDDD